MKKTTHIILSSFLAFNIVACGGETTSSIQNSDEVVVDTKIILAQATLGSLSGANVEIYEQGSNDLLYKGLTTKGDGKDILSAGLIKITPQEFKKIQNKMFIINISGGSDIDADDNSIWDIDPIENRGEIHAVVDSSSLDKNPFKINILTELIYQDIKEDIQTLSKAQINVLLDEKAQKILNDTENGGDINNDGKIDSKDLLNWNPITNKEDIKIDYEKEIKPLLSKIHNNEDIGDFSQELLRVKPIINVAKEDPKEEIIQAEEEAKKQAEENAKKQAEEDAKKQAEEDAKKKAEEDAKKQAEEDAKKQAEEDAKKKAEEDAKKQAEEDAIKIDEKEYDFSQYLHPIQNAQEIEVDKMENNSSIFKYKNIYFKNSDNTITQQPDYTLSQNIKYEITENNIEVSFNKNSSLQSTITLKRFIKIDEDITETSSDCILKNHTDTIVHNQKNYEDIIVIECRKNNTINSATYAKNMGIIIQNSSTIEVTNSSTKEKNPSFKIKAL